MKWQSFQSHLESSHSELYHTKNFADVTLVSDDLVTFPAHKTVLAASSRVFKTLLSLATPDQQQYPFLYLKDVMREDLESILQFIYLGEAQISEDKAEHFESIARDLGLCESPGGTFEKSQTRQIKQEKYSIDRLDFLSQNEENRKSSNFIEKKNLEFFDKSY